MSKFVRRKVYEKTKIAWLIFLSSGKNFTFWFKTINNYFLTPTRSTNDISKTRDTKRFILSGKIKLEGYKPFIFDILVKFYHEGEAKLCKGFPLSSIRFQFIVPKDPKVSSEDEDSQSGGKKGSWSDKSCYVFNDLTFHSIKDSWRTIEYIITLNYFWLWNRKHWWTIEHL